METWQNSRQFRLLSPSDEPIFFVDHQPMSTSETQHRLLASKRLDLFISISSMFVMSWNLTFPETFSSIFHTQSEVLKLVVKLLYIICVCLYGTDVYGLCKLSKQKSMKTKSQALVQQLEHKLFSPKLII